jgi:hypothetical protein
MRTVFSMMALCGFVLTGVMSHARQLSAESFSWSGELVIVEEASRRVTVKAPVVGDQAPADFGRLKAGERVMLGWSGYDRFADAILRVGRTTDVNKADERFAFPVEFVSFDPSRRYATFKVQIPEANVASVKELKPGEWVTATSPHGTASKTTPVVSIRPYVVRAGAGD